MWAVTMLPGLLVSFSNETTDCAGVHVCCDHFHPHSPVTVLDVKCLFFSRICWPCKSLKCPDYESWIMLSECCRSSVTLDFNRVVDFTTGKFGCQQKHMSVTCMMKCKGFIYHIPSLETDSRPYRQSRLINKMKTNRSRHNVRDRFGTLYGISPNGGLLRRAVGLGLYRFPTCGLGVSRSPLFPLCSGGRSQPMTQSAVGTVWYYVRKQRCLFECRRIADCGCLELYVAWHIKVVL